MNKIAVVLILLLSSVLLAETQEEVYYQALKAEEAGDVSGSVPEAKNQERIRIYVFQTLDRVIDAAKAIQPAGEIRSTLYKNPQNGNYYLVLSDRDSDGEVFSSACNFLSEYGTRARQNYSSESYYQEHFDVILKENALSSLRKI